MKPPILVCLALLVATVASAPLWRGARNEPPPKTGEPDRFPARHEAKRTVRSGMQPGLPASTVWPVASRPPRSVAAVALAKSRRDLFSAIAWTAQLPAEADRADALAVLAYEAARTDPLLALYLALELPPGDSRDDLLAHVVAQWAAADAEAAAAWVEELTDEPLQERLGSIVATVWADRAPRVAARYAEEALPPGRAQDDAVMGIVQRWAQTDPRAASAWVNGFCEGEPRLTAQEVLTSYASRAAR